MRQVNLGQGYSFYGSAGEWQAHDHIQDQHFVGSFAYLTAIYVESDREAHPGRQTHGPIADLQALQGEGPRQGDATEEHSPKEHSVEMLPGSCPTVTACTATMC